MLCQNCGKNVAEVHFIQNINGEKTEALLCGKCASESGLASPISFTSFLQGFINTPASASESGASLKCDKCGLTLDEIKKTGKAGCDCCYNVFRQQMDAIIKKVQAGNTHTGRFPKKANYVLTNRTIAALKNRLSSAVEKEDYEEAAKLRDEIRRLKAGDRNE